MSLLKAPSAPEFLTRHEAELLANDRAILKRVIHLLRVACVTSPTWLAEVRGYSSILSVPEGTVWATVVRRIDRYTATHRLTRSGFLAKAAQDAMRD